MFGVGGGGGKGELGGWGQKNGGLGGGLRERRARGLGGEGAGGVTGLLEATSTDRDRDDDWRYGVTNYYHLQATNKALAVLRGMLEGQSYRRPCGTTRLQCACTLQSSRGDLSSPLRARTPPAPDRTASVFMSALCVDRLSFQ